MTIAKYASSKKAHDIVIIDIRKIPNVADYFVITSGTSTTQVRAIVDNIIEKMREKKHRLWHIEGGREALWVVLDYGDVVVHVFYDETRRFYCLEKLWRDAPRIPFKEARKIPLGKRTRKRKRTKPKKHRSKK